MVRDLVDSLVAGIRQETPFLSNDALTPTELRTASEYDVGSGILDFKHFPEDVEQGQLFNKFRDAYRAVTRSIRISAQNVLNDITANVDTMPTYEDNDPVGASHTSFLLVCALDCSVKRWFQHLPLILLELLVVCLDML